MSQNPEEKPLKVVEANVFRLKDDEGRNRATLSMSNVGQPMLALYNEHGEIRLSLLLRETGEPGLCFQSGKKTINLIIDDKSGMGALSIADITSKAVVNVFWPMIYPHSC